MEFVVGQWVECVTPHGGDLQVSRAYQIEAMYGDGVVSLCNVSGVWDKERFKPFVWQVGKTYRTTLDGVTVPITSRTATSASGAASDKPGTLCFDARTGSLIGFDGRSDMPHLLPCLADEPSASTRSRDEAKAAIDRHDASETSATNC